MKNWLFALWILICFWSCESKPIQLEKVENKPIESQEVEKQEVEYVFRPSEYYSKFKFHNLKDFKIDDSGSLIDSLVRVDSTQWSMIFQDSEGPVISDFNRYYFYSNFSDSTLITILQRSEESGFIIWYMKFDSKGKLIYKEVLANVSGDGGEAYVTYGRFINHKYVRTDLSFQQKDKSFDKDSAILKFTFLPNGEVKTDTLFHKFSIEKY